jgi:hypothetical protein
MSAAVIKEPYDIRARRPRLTLSDLIVIVGAVALFLAGWAIKDWHDNRLRTVDVGGVSVSYPKSWIRFPSLPPELFRAISNDDGQTVAFLSGVETPQTDILLAIATNNANPASSELGFTQLGNTPATVSGIAAIQTDYTYVQSSISGSTVPVVIRGRQVSWISGGQLYSFGVEGNVDNWNNVKSELNRLVKELKING